MAGVAHDPAFAKKVGIPQKVGKDFNQADKGTGILRKKRKSNSPLSDAIHEAMIKHGHATDDGAGIEEK
jgi:hypothetical protein